jgi:fused signal recognition particle receptor
MIKHKYGADPAAVAFDAVKAKDKDIVLIDTAGRQTPDANLMEEMAKIKRVAKPDITIFVGESIAGSDLIEQAKAFNEKIGIDGVILTKADVDDKGGALLSVVQAINKPILYLGTGQEYKDLEKFEPEKFAGKIL